ncbi:hypothetical protein C8J57DRAFT_1529049 [Mycena rebaudengoi]|nr:hypothetical protein C8J57DRAFT_1529049 [Mycena rebaudengoi]
MSSIRSYDYACGNAKMTTGPSLYPPISRRAPSGMEKTHAAPSCTAPHTPAHPIARVWRAPITAGAIGMARGARRAGQERVHTTDRREASLRVWVRALRVSPEKMRAVPDPLYHLAHNEVDPARRIAACRAPEEWEDAEWEDEKDGTPLRRRMASSSLSSSSPALSESCASGGERARERRRRRHQALLALALINLTVSFLLDFYGVSKVVLSLVRWGRHRAARRCARG